MVFPFLYTSRRPCTCALCTVRVYTIVCRVCALCVPGCMLFSFYAVVFTIADGSSGGDDLTHRMRLTYVIISVERRSRTR